MINGGPLLDIEPFRDDWQGAVAREYEQLGHNLRQYNKGYTVPLRDPFAPIAVFVNNASPLTLYMEGVRNLLAARPVTTVSRHTHLRDCVMTLILVQTALRARNLLLRVDGDLDHRARFDHEYPEFRQRQLQARSMIAAFGKA